MSIYKTGNYETESVSEDLRRHVRRELKALLVHEKPYPPYQGLETEIGQGVHSIGVIVWVSAKLPVVRMSYW